MIQNPSPELHEAISAYAQGCYEDELNLLRTLAAIPSPTRCEELRAAFIADWLHEHGAANVHVDEMKNVICQLGPLDASDLVVFAAHTDIVFEDREELPLQERDGRLYAPGVGDDTANLVGLLFACAFLLEHPEQMRPDLGVLVVANSCEEGLGNCDGTRAVFDAYGDRIREFVSFDLYLPTIVEIPVGSHRFRISVHTQGGHSYHDFGSPNAIAELSGLICDLYALAPDPPSFLVNGKPVTLNVGTIEGGTTVNAIASSASALVEYRSTSDKALSTMHAQLQQLVHRRCRPGVEVELELLGIRPGMGKVDQQAHRQLVTRAQSVMDAVIGVRPSPGSASTDANIPLSLGIPAITVGAVRGALLHTRNEWIEAASLVDGLRVILGIMLASVSLERSS